MADAFILEMTGICKNFPGVKALDEVQLHVRKGTVHSLCGENGAGKSTLMKCLFGIYKRDEGKVVIDSEECNFRDPKHALECGVSMVHQELNQVLQRSVMENIWLGRFPKNKIGFVDHKKMFKDTKKIFDELEINTNPKTRIGTLSVSERQMVEIAKAVSYNTKLLVLDEPTSSLANEEIEQLFKIIRKLRDQGVGIIYISHKLDEILTISDDVTVMRDGKWITSDRADTFTTQKIISLMVGRPMENRFPAKINVPGETIMSVKNLTGMYAPSCIDVSFDLRKGEILGVAGLVGSRRTELLETIFGIAHHSAGEIYVHGKKIYNRNSVDAMKRGFAMLTEERRATGIFGVASVGFNSIIANIRGYSRYGFLQKKKMVKDTKWVIDSMRVKTPKQSTRIKELSGGNQQKVIIGRWLLTKPEIMQNQRGKPNRFASLFCPPAELPHHPEKCKPAVHERNRYRMPADFFHIGNIGRLPACMNCTNYENVVDKEIFRLYNSGIATCSSTD